MANNQNIILDFKWNNKTSIFLYTFNFSSIPEFICKSSQTLSFYLQRTERKKKNKLLCLNSKYQKLTIHIESFSIKFIIYSQLVG